MISVRDCVLADDADDDINLFCSFEWLILQLKSRTAHAG